MHRSNKDFRGGRTEYSHVSAIEHKRHGNASPSAQKSANLLRCRLKFVQRCKTSPMVMQGSSEATDGVAHLLSFSFVRITGTEIDAANCRSGAREAPILILAHPMQGKRNYAFHRYVAT